MGHGKRRKRMRFFWLEKRRPSYARGYEMKLICFFGFRKSSVVYS
jgi:hypothetical protein